MAQKSPSQRPFAKKLRQIRPRPCLTMNILTGAGERANRRHLLRLLEAPGAAHPQSKWLSPELLCQVAPAIFLGVQLRSLRSSAILSGLGTYIPCTKRSGVR